MNIYGDFANIYDRFINAPYEDWAHYIEELWQMHGALPKSVLDLACGTGGLTRILAKKGYDMIGVDISAEMLTVARQKGMGIDSQILYLQQDVREFELYGTVDAIVCVCDGINYLTKPKDLIQTFSLVRNYLNPSGLFVFDINSEYKYKNILSDNTFAQTDENAAYIWENYYDPNDRINEYDITFFVKEGKHYRRFEEVHTQKAHSVKEIKSALISADLEYITHYGELTKNEPKLDSERIFFVAQK